MPTFVDFVSGLIYGSTLAPNHRAWLLANPAPTGLQWFAHHVAQMLPAFKTWLASESLPPITAWDGTRPAPWDSFEDIPLPLSLAGGFPGIASLEDLGAALRDRLGTVATGAHELGGPEKAPFSWRYWGYVEWARLIRSKFEGIPVVPPAVLYDRDGTPLSAIPFHDVYNQCHWRWHLDPPASGPTPGFTSSAGQLAGSGGVGMTPGEEFIKFHHDHNEIYFRWLERLGQPAVRPINMSQGWPRPSQAGSDPSLWTEPDSDPWINAEGGDVDNNLKAKTSVNQIGSTIGGFHVSGHGTNTDLGSITHNNYVPRFFAWHGSIDGQWWWREPRFARWNATTGLRERVFRPVLSTGADWPGMHALTLVREPSSPADVISPTDGVSGLDLITGAGTLEVKLLAKDPYNRNLTLRLKAEVLDGTTVAETIPEATHTYTIGTGGDFALDTEFTVSLVFSSAFRSDDPARTNPAVGFVNSLIRVTGTLTVADGTDPDFVHRDVLELTLVREKQAPAVDLYLDISSFGEDQVNAAMSGGEARFSGALIVAVQDRTSPGAAISWPATVPDEVKGLIAGRVAASGLFDAPYEPEVVLWQDTVDAPISGVSLQLASGPLKEDPSLPLNLPQRYTYLYDVVFTSGHQGFDALPVGGARQARILVRPVDRSGNRGEAVARIKLFRAENPFMRDGDPSWLSVDTRVFRLFAGEAMFDGVTLAAGAPNAFIQAVLTKLNNTTLPEAQREAYFSGLATDQAGAALEYSTQITDHTTGTVRQVYNFTLAKVRLQGAAGAADVRTFFRLFRYAASNLNFDPALGYRVHVGAGTHRVPLLGFTAAEELSSIPFFAEARLPYTSAMTTQTDAPNVRSFPAGPTSERVLYFGAWLDINQNGSRLPAASIAAHPDGPFTAGEVQSIRSLMTDAHQCMVVEIRYDPDPTEVGASPASSDNLAQRNLLILTTDNPGGPMTHMVQHSFDVDLRCCGKDEDQEPMPPLLHGHAPAPAHANGHGHRGNGHQHTGVRVGEEPLLRFISAEHRERLVRAEAVSLAMSTPGHHHEGGHGLHNLQPFLKEAARRVDQRFPFVFDAGRWQQTGERIDELMFLWNDLPRQSRVELYLPGVRSENVVNLRNLRHAPGDVRIVDEHTLRLVPADVTYVPLPPVRGERLAGIVTVELPSGIRKGQRFHVDVVQVRAGERRTTGGFRLDVQVSEARQIADAERRLLEVMFERLSLSPRESRWRPVLARRVETIRERARALADSAGLPWEDPTLWTDPRDTSHQEPWRGPRMRVVLEKIQILEDRDPWIKGRGEIWFASRVYTSDNGGFERITRLPQQGVFKISGRKGRNVLDLNKVIFNGYAEHDLAVEILATEKDTFDPDDSVGKYTRLFCAPAESWFGSYGPGDEPVDPEEAAAWRVWYRIERA